MENNIDRLNDVTKENKNIIPAYEKIKQNRIDKNEKKVNKLNKNEFRVKSKISIIIFILIILIILALAVGGYIFFYKQKYDRYIKYEETVNTYCFNEMYNNHSSKTNESVTKSEAVKMVLSTILNIDDISAIAKEPSEQYDNAVWVEYAKDKEIINKDEITKENANEKALYIDVIRYFSNAKVKLLKKDVDTSNVPSIKDYEKYKSDEKLVISDTFNNKLINEKTDNLDGYKNIFKGELNELIVNYVTKYSTIAPEGEKLNIDPEKIPSNASEYAYTLASVDKSVYEMAFKKDEEKADNFKNPKTVYKEKKSVYNKIVNITEGYYNTILNVDYNTITEEEFRKKLSKYSIDGAIPSKINEYINYVKNNKIKTEGKAKVQAPIIYFDGSKYKIRVKLDFKIVNSNTKENLFYRDFDYKDFSTAYNAFYEKDEYVLYIDCVLSEKIDSKSLYIIENPILTTIINKNGSGISFKEIGE